MPEIIEINKLTKIGEEYGLEQNKLQALMYSYSDYFAKAKELVDGAMEIKVVDENDFDNMQKARDRRLKLKEVRVATENTRKELKEQSLREGKAIDGAANIIKALIEPVEQYLEDQEKFAENLAKQKKLDIEQTRIYRLSQFVANVEMYKLHPDVMDNQTFEVLIRGAEIAHSEQIKAEIEAEKARLEEQEKQKLENERIKKENEKLRIELEAEAKRKQEFENELKIQQAKEAKEREDLERKLREKEQAEEEEKRKQLEIENALKEAERLRALSPDKDKLIALADVISTIEYPALKDEKAMQLLVKFKDSISKLENELREGVKVLK